MRGNRKLGWAVFCIGLVFVSSVFGAVKTAYPIPGKTGLHPPEDVQRIVLGNFLDDFFRREAKTFEAIDDRIKRAVFAQVNSGAWQFPTDDKRVNFSNWTPVDLLIDYHWVQEKMSIKVDFYSALGNDSKLFLCKQSGSTTDWSGARLACEWVMEKILSTYKYSEADTKRVRKFFADRKPFFHAFYYGPGIVGHYTDNGVEPRLACAQDAYKASRFNPLMATRIVDAGYLAVTDKRKLKGLTPLKVKQIAMTALENVLGKVDEYDEIILRPFVYHYQDEVKKVLKGMKTRLDGGSLDNLENEVLSASDDDLNLDDDLSNDKKVSEKEKKAILAAIARMEDWMKNGWETPPPNPTISKQVADITTGGGEHPLFARHKLAAAFARKDAAFLEKYLDCPFRQTRAYALSLYFKLVPEKAYPFLLKAAEDKHTWARLYAAKDLATCAKASDAGKIKGLLAAEKNRAVKLYFADALAKAEGRPQPAPQPPANRIPKDRSLVWLCGDGGEYADICPWEAFYTCNEPALDPHPALLRAAKKGKVYITRPTPCGESCQPVSDPAMADTFWTTLDRQVSDKGLLYQDGFCFGEESMNMTPSATWATAWTVFCEECGIDPNRIQGDIKKLTPTELAVFNDWGMKVSIEGFNLMYDFTKDYFGKLKPGFYVLTYMPQQCGVGGLHADEWKFDIAAGYIYGTGPTRYPRSRCRAAYKVIRQLKTMWPDRPVQWLSCTIPRHPAVEKLSAERAAKAKAKRMKAIPLRDFEQIWEQERFFYRWDEPYAGNITCWQAGAMPGFFTSFSIHGPDGGEACVWLNMMDVCPTRRSDSLERGIQFAFAGTLTRYRDAMNRKDAPTTDMDDDVAGDDLELEEEGGADDPAFKKQQADMAAFRRGYQNSMLAIHDVAKPLVGMPHYDPGRFKSLILSTGGAYASGRGAESSVAQWMNGFDAADNANYPVKYGTLKDYRLIYVGDPRGQGTAMSEKTRKAYLDWLKNTPSILWVEGSLGEKPLVCVDIPKGDLKTKWPWDPVAMTNTTEALKVWRDPNYKGIVVYEKPAKELKEEVVEKAGKLLKAYFAKHNVEMNWPKAPGLISTKVGNLEVHSIGQWSKYDGTVEGIELYTGEKNPSLTYKDDLGAVMVVKGDYQKPYVAVHDGVRVLAGNPFTKVENVKGGLRVTYDPNYAPFDAPTALPLKDVKSSASGSTHTFTR